MIRKMIALDWRAMKVYQIRFPKLPDYVYVFGWLYTPLLVIPLCVIFCLSFSINPFAVEEKGELNKLYLTLPVKRKEVVAGRFALSLILLFCGMVMGIAILPLVNLVALSKWYLSLEWYLTIMALSVLLYAVFNLFMFPVLFRLGYQKGKFWGFYLPIGFFGIMFGGFSGISMLPGNERLALNFLEYASKNLLFISGGMVALGAGLLVLSYAISVKVYSKRDF